MLIKVLSGLQPRSSERLCKEGTKSRKGLKSKGETKDPLDYGLEGVALRGAGNAILQDRAGTGKQQH